MLNKLQKLREERANGEGGFTLIELLVVVVIIGILIAIAIPLYLNYQKGAKDKSAMSDLRGAVSVFEQCNSDNGSYPSAVSTTGAMTGCANQLIKLSAGTTMSTYTAANTNTTYIAVTTNSGGNSKWYCYNSTNAGSIVTSSTAITTC
ncbi:prepilin-type N-terminal cleavage/methylation domain-containing protein [Jatrophihabitans telluris]|uniref:prepilin-type N-terminal cleavage/methylation domain-containing protein n=1 Tax=Jatrophihabitans telluris TaxID=2038343 RepID=UPI0024BFD265|nr:prepilin-type N-terminal cleavage/methylation domain-containing protein [Jatrophihabitans telluris]